MRSNTLSVSRVIDAPPMRVWQAWTDPETIAEWWGPEGFTTTTREFSLTVGGYWRFTMHGPDGTDYPNVIHFTQVEPGRLLAWDQWGEGDFADFHHKSVVSFIAREDQRTEVVLTSVLPSAERLEELIRDFGAEKGAHDTLRRLDEVVGTLAQGSQ
ncbi:MAG: SRPBCC domain-containing protein [Fimbriimonadaceae bacterium]